MKTPSKKHFAALTLSMLLLTTSAVSLASAQGMEAETTTVAAADTEAPSDVLNVKATPDDAMVKLTWDAANDDTAVKGYKVYYGKTSVTADGGSYEMGPEDAGDNLSYEVKNLENGKKYYFAVTAYDAAGNESSNFSIEVSSTPVALHAAADTTAPQVAKAEALNKTTVAVTFSKPIVLPSTNPASAFSVKEDVAQTALDVTNAAMDTKDTSNKTVLLTTAEQKAGVNYIVTAGIQIKDNDNNPVKSGTSDTAIFTGSDKDSTANSDTNDVTPPELAKVTVPDNAHLEVTFSEPIVLAAKPTQNFIITEVENIEKTLDVKEAKLSSDGKKVTLTTAPQKELKYNLIVLDVADKAGNMISVDKNATVFTGVKAAEETTQPGETETTKPTEKPTETGTQKDTTAPEDATNFVAKSLKKMIVTLQWKPSVNKAGDLDGYVLYQSKDGVNYDKGIVLKSDSTMYDLMGLNPGVKYFFKLAAKDTTGNESKGVVTTFTLPGTGPELLFLLAGSAGIGKFMTRKKKKTKK